MKMNFFKCKILVFRISNVQHVAGQSSGRKNQKKNEKTYSKGDIAAVRSYGCFGYVQTMQTEAVGNDLRKLSEPNLCTYWRQQQRKIASVRNAPKLTSAKHSLIGLRFRCNFQSVFNR